MILLKGGWEIKQLWRSGNNTWKWNIGIMDMYKAIIETELLSSDTRPIDLFIPTVYKICLFVLCGYTGWIMCSSTSYKEKISKSILKPTAIIVVWENIPNTTSKDESLTTLFGISKLDKFLILRECKQSFLCPVQLKICQIHKPTKGLYLVLWKHLYICLYINQLQATFVNIYIQSVYTKQWSNRKMLVNGKFEYKVSIHLH